MKHSDLDPENNVVPCVLLTAFVLCHLLLVPLRFAHGAEPPPTGDVAAKDSAAYEDLSAPLVLQVCLDSVLSAHLDPSPLDQEWLAPCRALTERFQCAYMAALEMRGVDLHDTPLCSSDLSGELTAEEVELTLCVAVGEGVQQLHGLLTDPDAFLNGMAALDVKPAADALHAIRSSIAFNSSWAIRDCPLPPSAAYDMEPPDFEQSNLEWSDFERPDLEQEVEP